MHLTDERLTADALAALGDRAKRVPAREWPPSSAQLQHAGLYAWWVDAAGAAMLSEALGDVAAGRIYAGQAGATRFPSGKRSGTTLRSRIGLHLHASIRESTFRWTLAAALRSGLELEVVGPRRLAGDDKRRLSEWMAAHLEIAIHAVSDRDRLGSLEKSVLRKLDPPLNLEGMEPTPLRQRLTELRTQMAHPDRS